MARGIWIVMALDLCTAFGVVVGGTLLAGIGAVGLWMSPASVMLQTAAQLKIWAIVAAIGGSIDPLRLIEANLLEGHLTPVAQQLLYIAAAFIGAHLGSELIRWICRSALEATG